MIFWTTLTVARIPYRSMRNEIDGYTSPYGALFVTS
jgi:hypothetical protein